MAEVETQVIVYNKALISFKAALERLENECSEEHRTEFEVASGLFSIFLAQRRKDALEEILSDRGLEVCHFSDIHYHSPAPDGWNLSEADWRMGLFLKSEERLYYRAQTKTPFGGNTKPEVINPELIVLCPEHYPKYGVTTSASQTKDGWLTNIQSSVTVINGVLRPIAELAINIEQPAIRKRPESLYRHFGFIC